MIVLFDRNDPSPASWPPGFFDEILITDPAFVRPAQGEMTPVAALDALVQTVRQARRPPSGSGRDGPSGPTTLPG